jgi:hypothetical protein
MFCIGCGKQLPEEAMFCSNCGIERSVKHESVDYQKTYEPAIEGFNDENVVLNSAKLASNHDEVKDRSVLMPALAFSAAAICAGLLFSYVIDNLLADALRSPIASLVYEIDRSAGRNMMDMDFSLGMITVWLLTCLGGLNVNVSGNTAFMMQYDVLMSNLNIKFGLVILTLVPILSLSIATVARRIYIEKYDPGKEIKVMDGLVGAGLFTILNVMLAAFPSSIEKAIGAAFNSYMQGTAQVIVNVSPQFHQLILSSLAMSLIFALPSIKSIFVKSRQPQGFAKGSFASALMYIQTLLLSALIVAVVGAVITIYNILQAGDSFLIGNTIYEDYVTTTAIALVPNMGIWYMSIFTGGAINISGKAPLMALNGSVTFSGVEMSMPPYIDLQMSWFGLPLLITGLVIAVMAVYQTLRDDDKYITKGLTAAALSAVVVWIISTCADIGFTVASMNERVSFLMSSSSISNMLSCAIIMCIAVGVLHFARKSPSFDKVVEKVARPKVAYALSLASILFVGFTGRLT